MATKVIQIERRRAWLIGLSSFVVVAYPSVYALLHDPARAGFAYVFGDSFLYLTIARRSHLGWFTYDGTTPTNGFHPLWQYLLTALFSGQSSEHAGEQVALVTLLSTVLTATGVALSNVTVFRLTGSRLLAFLGIPGLYYLLAGSYVDNLAAWEWVSGMECGLSAFFTGLLLFVFSRKLGDGTRTIDDLVDERGFGSTFLQMGFVLPFLVLTRLDDVFVAGAVALAPLVLSSRSVRDRMLAALRISLPTGIVLVAHMVHGQLYAGSALPISGMAKGGFVLPSSIYVTLASLFPPLVDLKNAVASPASNSAVLSENAFRGIQLLVPGAVAALFLYVERRRLRWATGAVLGGFAVGILVKVLYNLANVNLWHQGGWYFAFNVILVTVFGSVMIEDAYAASFPSAGLRVVAACALGLAVTVTSAKIAVQHAFPANDEMHAFWRHRDEATRALSSQVRSPRLLSYDDGAAGYLLPCPTIHGFAFAADLSTLRALGEGRLLEHAYRRGHRIITSADYLDMHQPIETSEGLREYLRTSILDPGSSAELDSYDFRLLYIQPDTHTPFIEFWPRGTAPSQNGAEDLVPQVEATLTAP